MFERYEVTPPNVFIRMRDGRPVYAPLLVVRTDSIVHIYYSGRTAMTPDGTLAGIGDMRVQMATICEAIRDSLACVGATLDDMVRTVTYVTDAETYFKVADERFKYFTGPLPTSTLVEISRLADPAMLIEIEGEAAIAPDRLRLPADARKL